MVGLTLDIYGHLTDRMTERAAARMDAIFDAAAIGQVVQRVVHGHTKAPPVASGGAIS